MADTAILQHPSLERLFRTEGTEQILAPGTSVARQGEPVRAVYRIVAGCARLSVYTAEGERRVLQFLGRGDVFGLNGATEWSASHEAVDTLIVRRIPVERFERALAADEGLQRAVRASLGSQIERQVWLAVRTTIGPAVDRVRSFLEDFSDRRHAAGFVALPMGRRDIADHLGLSMETVSRSISALRDAGEIELRGAAFYRLCDGAEAASHAA